MKKERFYIMLYLLTILLLILSSTYILFKYNKLKEQKLELDMRYIGRSIDLPRPKVIEKEVIVYVEKEQESEPELAVADITPQINLQPINYNFDIMTPSNLKSEDVIRALGDVRKGLHTVADYIIQAEQTYGVNALYLTAVLGLESGWGKYEHGINNIAGWKGGPNGTFSNFESRYDCIMTVAEGLSTHFVDRVGSNISDVAIMYCPDYGYLDLLLQIMGELQNNI